MSTIYSDFSIIDVSKHCIEFKCSPLQSKEFVSRFSFSNNSEVFKTGIFDSVVNITLHDSSIALIKKSGFFYHEIIDFISASKHVLNISETARNDFLSKSFDIFNHDPNMGVYGFYESKISICLSIADECYIVDFLLKYIQNVEKEFFSELEQKVFSYCNDGLLFLIPSENTVENIVRTLVDLLLKYDYIDKSCYTKLIENYSGLILKNMLILELERLSSVLSSHKYTSLPESFKDAYNVLKHIEDMSSGMEYSNKDRKSLIYNLREVQNKLRGYPEIFLQGISRITNSFEEIAS